MNDNTDIKKQLEIKNKEIYLHKLSLDLANNLEVLVLTIDNLLNTYQKESIRKVLEINESFLHQKEIKEYFQTFLNNYQIFLMELLEEKKQTIQNGIDININLDEMKEKIATSYLKLKDSLEEKSLELLQTLEFNLKGISETTFQNNRLTFYLNNIFLLNLNNKIFDVIKNRDTILMNTFNDTYLKYLDLNKKTVGN